MKVLVRVLLTLLLLPLASGCGVLLRAEGEETVPVATNPASPIPTATDTIDLDAESHEPPSELSGIVYLIGGRLRLLGQDGDRVIARLPDDAGRLTLSSDKLAYESGSQLYSLSLADGTESLLSDFSHLPFPDFSLCWSSDSSALAYAVAWDESDGSRMVELGTVDSSGRQVVDTLVGREAGPVPTPPPLPHQSGFVNLVILAYSHVTDHIMVTPAGGEKRYDALWGYRPEAPGRQEVFPSLPDDVQALASTPDATRLALARLRQIEIWLLHTDASRASVTLPPDTHTSWLSWSPDGLKLAYVVTEGEAPRLEASPAEGIYAWIVQRQESVPIVADLDAWATVLGWTADSKAVLVETYRLSDGRPQRSLIDVETGQTRTLELPEGARVLGWVGEGW